MSKILVFIVFVVLVLTGAFLYFYLKLGDGGELVKPLVDLSFFQDNSKREQKLLYEDEAGFSFNYPSKLGIIEKDANDEKTYSSLELVSKDFQDEKFVIKIVDSTFADPDKWLVKNPHEGNLISTKESEISGMKGKFYQFENPSRNLIAVLDSKILYTFESPGGDFWNKAFETVTSSFILTEEQNSSQASGGSSIVEEEEEIIE